MRARLLAPLVLLAAALGLSACGSKVDVINPPHLATVSVALDAVPGADEAALYAAISNRYFAQAGITVVPRTAANPGDPLAELASGQVNMAIADEPELLLARNAGQSLVAIGALVDRPLASIIAPGNQHITSAAKLAGKRVGTGGLPFQTTLLDAILRRAGVPVSSVKQTDVGTNLVRAMVSGKVAATFGGDWNDEALQLAALGKHPSVIPVDQAGVPTYDELVLVVRTGEAVNDGVMLRAFMQALSRGQRAVQDNPQAAVTTLAPADPTLSARLALASLKATLPATEASGGNPYGWQNPTDWHDFAVWMQAHGLIRSAVSDDFAYTNEYLPGQGVPLTGVNTPDQ
ncbi:MAG TPA: ABC transporter substrate-binding protein [Solirubrobacteraceae bacterium]|nr:ABC transporter substrate-binding protein [Solirubrobacteraceae bacterium]